MIRSSKPDVRNPLAALPAAQRLRNLSPEARGALDALLLDMRADAQARAQESWRRSKGPMAAYWKAVATYAGHTRRLVR